MCIAIVKPQGTVISDEYLESCFDNNSDGAGIAYAKDGQLYIMKGIFDCKKFIKAVREVEQIAEGDILIHCRIGTSGLKDKNNCHPHKVNDSLVMIHNGILNIDVPKTSKKSDTIIFIDKYLKHLKKDFVKDKSIMKLIEFGIGEGNKLAFLNNKGESFICNKQEGVIEGGIWYSNESYQYGNYFFHGTSEDGEIYDYFSELVNYLDYEDLQAIGDYPLIDLEEYQLESFSLDKYRDTNKYIALKHYDITLYEIYMEKYNDYKERLSA